MRLFLIALLAMLTVHTANAGDLVVTKESAHNVPTTLDRLEKILKSKGITIFARVDHAAGARNVEIPLKPTALLIFGNPKLGTPLMQSNRAMGLDLPMKALAWEDEAGKTYLSYTAPAALKERHAITDRDPIFKKMTGALDKFTSAAVAAQ